MFEFGKVCVVDQVDVVCIDDGDLYIYGCFFGWFVMMFVLLFVGFVLLFFLKLCCSVFDYWFDCGEVGLLVEYLCGYCCVGVQCGWIVWVVCGQYCWYVVVCYGFDCV